MSGRLTAETDALTYRYYPTGDLSDAYSFVVSVSCCGTTAFLHAGLGDLVPSVARGICHDLIDRGFKYLRVERTDLHLFPLAQQVDEWGWRLNLSGSRLSRQLQRESVKVERITAADRISSNKTRTGHYVDI